MNRVGLLSASKSFIFAVTLSHSDILANFIIDPIASQLFVISATPNNKKASILNWHGCDGGYRESLRSTKGSDLIQNSRACAF
jgi:hypothetical protein